MTLPAAASRSGTTVLTADGANALGAAGNPFVISLGGAPLLSGPASTAGATITAAAATSMLPAAAKFNLPANWWAVGRTLRLTASGLISSVITTPGTARFDVRMGSNVVFDSQAILLDTVAAHTNVGWLLEIILTCRSVGAVSAATLWGSGKFTCESILGTAAGMPKADGVAVLPWNAAPSVGAGFDSTVVNAFDMDFTQTVATGSLTLEQFFAELVGG